MAPIGSYLTKEQLSKIQKVARRRDRNLPSDCWWWVAFVLVAAAWVGVVASVCPMWLDVNSRVAHFRYDFHNSGTIVRQLFEKCRPSEYGNVIICNGKEDAHEMQKLRRDHHLLLAVQNEIRVCRSFVFLLMLPLPSFVTKFSEDRSNMSVSWVLVCIMMHVLQGSYIPRWMLAQAGPWHNILEMPIAIVCWALLLNHLNQCHNRIKFPVVIVCLLLGTNLWLMYCLGISGDVVLHIENTVSQSDVRHQWTSAQVAWAKSHSEYEQLKLPVYVERSCLGHAAKEMVSLCSHMLAYLPTLWK